MDLDEQITESLIQNWVPDEENTTESLAVTNSYLKLLETNTGLKVIQHTKVTQAFTQSGKLGLFRLFLTNSWFKGMRTWLNKKLKQAGKDEISERKFRAYMGLEMATSLVKMNDLKSYWKKEMFAGHRDFKETMSRDDFLFIRSNIVLRDPDDYSHEEASSDPLWHSRKILNHFQKNVSQIAVPMGTSALDEAGVRTKARTKASSYIANKPDKYAIRFYAVVGSQNAYLFNIFDNRSGNTSGVSPPEAFCRLHREMRTPYNNIVCNSPSIDKDSPTALWILMMAYQTKLAPQPNGKRIFFTDNFYTRHTLAKVLKDITDGEARLIGTVKYTNVDATNRTYLVEGIASMKDAPRGSWKLIQAFDKVADLDKIRRKHATEQKKLPVAQRVAFVAPKDNVAENAGYIIWKDSKVVIFYCNDMASTPSHPILDGTSEEAIKCVNGLASLSRWVGGEVLNRTDFEVPAIIVAYNNYMNSVDRMDQIRATNPNKRREKRLHMSIWTYVLDLAALQAFALFEHMGFLQPGQTMTYSDFKRHLCEDLVSPYKAVTGKRNRIANEAVNEDIDVRRILGSNEHVHMLIENKNKQDIHCMFCMLRGIKKMIYGCVKYGKGFHVNCYTAYHCQWALQGDSKALCDMIVRQSPNELPRASNKRSKFIGTMKEMKLTK